jgi:SAM-dependent methyltransferase
MATKTTYVLGQSDHEHRRLIMQGRIVRQWTDRFFRAAGIGTGMSVLDLGSGVGDVALLASELVGPGGRVLGIDRDAGSLDLARERAAREGHDAHVTFQATDIEAFETTGRFDAIVGRLVLLYQPDPARAIRHVLRFLRPGGIAVFHEIDFANQPASWPPCAAWDLHYGLIGEVFRRAGAPPDFGRRLGPTFLDAGLPWPNLDAGGAVGGGKGSFLYPWLATSLLSVVPKLDQLGVALPDGVRIDDTLAARLEAAAVEAGSQVLGPVHYGAWARKA